MHELDEIYEKGGEVFVFISQTIQNFQYWLLV